MRDHETPGGPHNDHWPSTGAGIGKLDVARISPVLEPAQLAFVRRSLAPLPLHPLCLGTCQPRQMCQEPARAVSSLNVSSFSGARLRPVEQASGSFRSSLQPLPPSEFCGVSSRASIIWFRRRSATSRRNMCSGSRAGTETASASRQPSAAPNRASGAERPQSISSPSFLRWSLSGGGLARPVPPPSLAAQLTSHPCFPTELHRPSRLAS